jgi:3',5'-cyclic-AMP phosphodiesterase
MNVDRRGFLECMAWAGTGVVWTLVGGVPRARGLAEAAGSGDGYCFAQISDTHVGFGGEANRDAAGTLQQSIDRINALPCAPDFVIHTGDLSHAQKAGAFDQLAQAMKNLRTQEVFYVPGEHDVFVDGGKEFLARFGKGTEGTGWRSFDHRGVHFVGLVNVVHYKGEGMGALGAEQIEWLERDLARYSPSTPIVIYAHVPLWAVYPTWGWTTSDATQALAYVKRFGSVTVLNGHIHQIMQKVEGNVQFFTARSTAFPQPAPGSAPAPGPMKVPADQVKSVLGIREVTFVESAKPLAVTDRALA